MFAKMNGIKVTISSTRVLYYTILNFFDFLLTGIFEVLAGAETTSDESNLYGFYR